MTFPSSTKQNKHLEESCSFQKLLTHLINQVVKETLLGMCCRFKIKCLSEYMGFVFTQEVKVQYVRLVRGVAKHSVLLEFSIFLYFAQSIQRKKKMKIIIIMNKNVYFLMSINYFFSVHGA